MGKASKTAAKSVSTSATLASLTNSTFLAAYEQAKTILDTGGDIDDHLWAKLIKCRILDLKKEVQNRTLLKTVCQKNRTSNIKSLEIITNTCCFFSSQSATPATTTASVKPDKSKSPAGKKSPKQGAAAAKKQSPGGQLSTADTIIEKSIGVKTRDQIENETKYIGMLIIRR